MDLEAIVHKYISDIRPLAEAELDWFRQQPTLESAIDIAARAVDEHGKQFPHEHKIPREAIQQARQLLLANVDAISHMGSFDDLFAFLKKMLIPIYGIGELYIYDTSLRIGAKLGLLPKRVYLHAGTKIGAKRLGFPTNVEALEMNDLQRKSIEFLQLQPHEIEDVLCIFKDDFDLDDSEEWRRRSWCIPRIHEKQRQS